MKVIKIALTGGPCGGKTTAIQEIQSEFEEKGYNIYVVPEAATILINSGIKPFGNNGISLIDFQDYVIELQLKLEELAITAAKVSKKDSIVLCDRGLLDDKAYVTDEEFQKLLSKRNKKEIDIMNSYDLVIHLKTAAIGAEKFYTLDNNSARTETIEEAREKDNKTLKAWLGHDNLKILGNDVEFKEKINNALYEIYNTLNRPYPVQKQYKFLVDNFDEKRLNMLNPVKLYIEQYIINKENKDIIFRKTTKDYDTSYKTITKIDTEEEGQRLIIKKNITEETFYENTKDNNIMRKHRYCFAYQNEYFRLDVFENGLILLEIEETNKTKNVDIPDFILIKKDVTNDYNYRNSNIIKNKVYTKNIKTNK